MVLTVPLVGDIEVTVAAVALLTVNDRVTFPPSGFTITRFHVPGMIPLRAKVLLRVVAVSEPITVLVMVDCPVLVRVTVGPLKPVPRISIVCWPLFTALGGDMLPIVRVDVEGVPVAVKVIGVSDPLVAIRELVPAVVPNVQLLTAAIPFVFVVIAVVGDTIPLPKDMVNVTGTPLTGLLFASFTMTLGGAVTAVPTVAV